MKCIGAFQGILIFIVLWIMASVIIDDKNKTLQDNIVKGGGFLVLGWWFAGNFIRCER